MQAAKEWSSLSEEEQDTKVRQIYQALKDNDIAEGIKIEIVDQVIVPLRSKTTKRQKVLTVEGNVSKSKVDNLKKFNAEAKLILAGIHPQSASVHVTSKLATGGDY